MPSQNAARFSLLLGLTLGFGFVAGCDRTEAKPAAQNAAAAPGEGESCEACCAVETSAPATRPAAPTTMPAEAAGEWRTLFDGKSLKNWKTGDFAGHGEPVVEDGLLFLPAGEGLTGVTWTGDELPRTNYEIQLVSKRVDGVDFFSGITFPVGDSYASFINGGWGGAVVGISSIDDQDASQNDTTVYEKFEKGKFYTFRLRVEPHRIQAWINDEQAVDADIKDKKVGVRVDIEQSKPLGIASWQTTGAIKEIKIRTLGEKSQGEPTADQKKLKEAVVDQNKPDQKKPDEKK